MSGAVSMIDLADFQSHEAELENLSFYLGDSRLGAGPFYAFHSHDPEKPEGHESPAHADPHEEDDDAENDYRLECHLSEDVIELIFPQLEEHVPDWDCYGQMELPPECARTLADSICALIPRVTRTANRAEALLVLRRGLHLGSVVRAPWELTRARLCETLAAFSAWLRTQSESGRFIYIQGI